MQEAVYTRKPNKVLIIRKGGNMGKKTANNFIKNRSQYTMSTQSATTALYQDDIMRCSSVASGNN